MKTCVQLRQSLAQFSLKWEMFQTTFVQTIKANFTFSNFFFLRKSCRLWDKAEKPDRLQMAARRMRIPCWITEATNTHSEYVILNAFPLQQWLHERSSILRYTYIACLVFLLSFFYFFVLTLLFISSWSSYFFFPLLSRGANSAIPASAASSETVFEILSTTSSTTP